MLYKFFDYYTKWNWQEPVLMSLSNKRQAKGGLRTNDIKALDKYSYDAMIVLIPSDQLLNTSYRVKEHNLNIIINEIERG